MPRRTRWTATIGAALTLLAAAGCTPAPTVVVGCASPAGESRRTAPDDGAPEPTLLGELQLTESGEEYPQALAVRPSGGAYVVMTDVLADRSRLLTIAAAGGAYEVAREMDLPSGDVADLLLLPDDRILIVGALKGDDPGYGFSVVDAATGSHEDRLLIPATSQDSVLVGDAVRSPDGRTLYVYLETYSDGEGVEEESRTHDLVAVDLDTGEILSRRDVRGDLEELTGFLAGTWTVALLPRAAGGASLAVNAAESPSAWDRTVPALLPYDVALEPEGDPVVLAPAEDGLALSATTAGSHGTTFLLLESNDAGSDTRVIALPEGGSPTLAARFCAEDDSWVGSLAVVPSQAWVVVPTLRGVRSLGLAGGTEDGPSLTFDCLEEFDGGSWHSDASPGVHWMVSSEDTSTLLAVGECDTGGLPPPTLWILRL